MATSTVYMLRSRAYSHHHIIYLGIDSSCIALIFTNVPNDHGIYGTAILRTHMHS